MHPKQKYFKALLFSACLMLSLNSVAQTEFFDGYFIDNDNQTTKCLIRKDKSVHNPRWFSYKLEEGAELQSGNISQVKEYGISGLFIYERHVVQIDRSSNQLRELGEDRQPLFQEETLFLKVLVRGKANLYLYDDVDLRRFFYSEDNSDVEQLIYKRFRNEDQVVKNNAYLQQIWTRLQYPGVTDQKVREIDYNTGSLVNYFTMYNSAYDAEYEDFSRAGREDQFKLRLKGGIAFTNLSLYSSLSSLKVLDLPGSTFFYPGLEMEYAIPKLNNSVSLTLSPSYQSYSDSVMVYPDRIRINYYMLEIPIGMRFNKIISDRSRVFVGASGDFNFSLRNGEVILYPDRNLRLKTSLNFSISAGYVFNDKYSLELNYQIPHDILLGYPGWDTNYSTFAIFLSYRLFAI